MSDIYIYRNGQKMRCGYTTGSCAAGAAKAAAEMLFGGKTVDNVRIMTPKGIVLDLAVKDQKINNKASCCIVKDGGDDPDVTDGMRIYAEVERISNGIEISGGEGIGKVTKSGLDQPVGEWAINSIPRKMITAVLTETALKYNYSGGFRVVIYAPEGRVTALKTYNPRMGITDGISIIGTSGIVEPMSSKAIIETIRTEARIKKLSGEENMILTLGNYGESFLTDEMPFLTEKSIKCSNFIGDAVEIGMEMDFKNILIIGHIGKLVKLGAGIMNTHSGCADGRMDVLVTCGVLAGVETSVLKKIPSCAVVDSALEVFENAEVLDKVMDVLSERAGYYLDAKVNGKVRISAVMFSFRYGVLVRTSGADDIIEHIKEVY